MQKRNNVRINLRQSRETLDLDEPLNWLSELRTDDEAERTEHLSNTTTTQETLHHNSGSDRLSEALTKKYLEFYPEHKRIINTDEEVENESFSDIFKKGRMHVTHVIRTVIAVPRIHNKRTLIRSMRNVINRVRSDRRLTAFALIALVLITLPLSALAYSKLQPKSQVLGENSDSPTAKPSYEYLKPRNTSDVQAKAYDPQSEVVSLASTIGDSNVVMTQQKLSDTSEDGGDELKSIAEKLGANEVAATEKGRVFYTDFDKNKAANKQIALFKHEDVLVHIVLVNSEPFSYFELVEFVNALSF